jgi:hypothetical protein
MYVIIFYILGVSFFNERNPKLIFYGGLRAQQFIVTGWKEIIDHHIHPLTKPPKPEVENANIVVVF